MTVRNNIFPALVVFFLGCNSTTQYSSPTGYDFNKPEKFEMKNTLNEISGITFLPGNEHTIYAIEDETGELFSVGLGSKELTHSKFGKKGDYEDVTVFNENTFAVLKSDGSLFMFPVNQTAYEKIDSVQEYNNILPAGEYEGLCADSDKLLVLCKSCPGDKQKNEVSIYALQKTLHDSISLANSFRIDVSAAWPKGENEKEKFHPSGIAKNPATQEWYIISSVNKLLVVLDDKWNFKKYYPLNPSLFKQPEGITFSSNGDLYISNEGGEGVANILLFRHQEQ